MKKISEMDDAELSAFVQAHLKNAGLMPFSRGGGAVAIYSNNKYVSKDLDLVIYAVNHKKNHSHNEGA